MLYTAEKRQGVSDDGSFESTKRPGKRYCAYRAQPDLSVGLWRLNIEVELALLPHRFRRLRLPNLVYLKAERGFSNLVRKKAPSVAEGNERPADHGHKGFPLRENPKAPAASSTADQAGL